MVKDQDTPLISIVILSWNTREVLRQCLSSILEHTKSAIFEIIVVDNASEDGSVEMVTQEFPSVHLIKNEENIGTRGFNQGMRFATGDLLLIMGSDTYVCDDVIGKMAYYMMSDPQISMAGCQLRYPDKRLQRSANRSLSIWRSLFEDLWLYKFVSPSMRDNILLGGFWDHSSEKEVDWIAGPFMMVRRETFEKVGGLSEDIFMHGDDNEWCTRIKKAGGRVFYNPIGIVYHIGSVASENKWNHKQWLRLCHLGGLWVYSKMNGSFLGFFFHVAKLFGSSFRLIVYTLLCMLKPNDYYRYQRRYYGWLVEFYIQALKPGFLSQSLERK